MVTRYWVADMASIDTPTAWDPQGAPAAGDTGVIQSGTATADNETLDGYTLNLAGRAQATEPTLDLRYSVLGAGEHVLASGVTDPSGDGFGRILAEGSNQNAGLIEANFLADSVPATLRIDIADTVDAGGNPLAGASFVNTGTIATLGSLIDIEPGSSDALLINNGTLSDAGSMTIGVPVTGSGTIALTGGLHGGYGTITFTGGVSQGQAVIAHGDMTIDDPGDFHALISGFSSGPFAIDLPDFVSSVRYTGDSSGGQLALLDGAAVVGSLRFDGSYTAGQFQLSQGSDHSTLTLAASDGGGSTGGGGTGGGTTGGDAGQGPVITVPAAEEVASGGSLAVTGISVADSFAASNPGTLALNVTDSDGALRMTDANGNPITGSGTGAIHYSGTLAEINAALASLSYTAGASPGSDTITVDVWDQAGIEASKAIAVTVDEGTGSGSGTGSGGGQVITGGPGDDSIVSTLGQATIDAGGGNNVVFAGGSGNVVTAGNGSNTIQAFDGGNRITTGSGADTIRIAGSGSTVDAGGGVNRIEDSGGGNTIVLPAAGAGSDDIYGYVLQSGDVFDLRGALAGTGYDGNPADAGNWVQVGSANGVDAQVAIFAAGNAGQSGAAGSVVATLHGSGPVTAQAFLQHAVT